MVPMSRLLFLCTGNLYRSRFAEEYFRAVAADLGLEWTVSSRGLAERPDPRFAGQAISPVALDWLGRFGIEPLAAGRTPRTASLAELLEHSQVIALDRAEHEPLLSRRFPGLSIPIEFWHIGDVQVEPPALALPRLVDGIDSLVDRLQRTSRSA